MQVDQHFPQLPLDLTVVHTLTGGGDFCRGTGTESDLHSRKTREKHKHRCAAYQVHISNKAGLTLGFHSISDGTGITQPVGIGCPH